MSKCQVEILRVLGGHRPQVYFFRSVYRAPVLVSTFENSSNTPGNEATMSAFTIAFGRREVG